jgi:hypothetical protein
MDEKISQEMLKKMLAEARSSVSESTLKRSAKLFEALDDAILAEVRRGGPIDSAVHWSAIATLIAKTVMFQELQTGNKDMFDTACFGVVEAARAVYKEGFNLEK